MLDKQIHANELKLRLLLTNECNLSCSFCLNDFQPKGREYLPLETAIEAIDRYVEHVQGKYPVQIYLSGGEPTLHPDFFKILEYALKFGRVTLNTNGLRLVFAPFNISKLADDALCIHIGATEALESIAALAKKTNANIQLVLVDLDKTQALIDFYTGRGIPVKVFDNFLDQQPDRYRVLFGMNMPNPLVDFRFTGRQENRGPGCDGCELSCITLKALWVRPNGTASPCAQFNPGMVDYLARVKMSEVDAFHRVKGS